VYSILVVDDEEDLRKQLVSLLCSRGYQVDEAGDGMEAAQKLASGAYSLILCDVRMPRLTGLELLKHVNDREISTTVALITAHANVKDAVEAMREGAFDYIEKPINETTLLELVAKAKKAHDMIQKISLSAPMLSPGEGRECVGQSKEMKRVFPDDAIKTAKGYFIDSSNLSEDIAQWDSSAIFKLITSLTLKPLL
jgi:DNA-binding NtrC family response regulator